MSDNTCIPVTRVVKILKKNELFENISQEHFNQILNFSSIIKVEEKEFIFIQEAQAQNLYIIIEGMVAMFSETPHGQEIFSNIAKSGDMIGETALLNDFPYNLNTKALSKSSLLKIPANKIKSFLQKNPTLSFNFLNKITLSYCKLVAKIERNSTLMAPQRLGCFLLTLDKRKLSNGTIKVTFPYEKKIVASYLKMTPETFSRSILYMERYGIKTDGNSIIIDDINKLKKFSCHNCTKLSDEAQMTCAIYTK